MQDEVFTICSILNMKDSITLESQEAIQKHKILKPFIKYKEKNRLDKLVSIIEKFKKSNTPLTKAQLLEYFSAVYSNFVPNGSYGVIKSTKIIPASSSIEAIVKYDNMAAYFYVDTKEENNDIRLKLAINVNDQYHTYDTKYKELYTNNKKIKNEVYELNHRLIEDMANYMLDVIKGE